MSAKAGQPVPEAAAGRAARLIADLPGLAPCHSFSFPRHLPLLQPSLTTNPATANPLSPRLLSDPSVLLIPEQTPLHRRCAGRVSPVGVGV